MLAVLALHLVATAWGSHALWGFATFRYLSPPLALTLGVLWALALVPPIARRVEPVLTGAGFAWPFWLATAVGLVAVWNDRLHFLGDWLLRRGSVALELALTPLYPQAMPLDLLFHVSALRPLGKLVGVDNATRIVGALEVTLLVVAALAFRSRLRLGPRAGFAIAAVAIAGGYLQLFTGFNKSVCDLCVFIAAAMALAVAAPASGASLIGLGAVAALATLLHRAGVLLVPAVLVAIVLRSRRAELRPAARWLPSLVALLVPAAALAFIGDKIWHLLLTFDWPKHVAMPGTSPLVAAIRPGHLLDLVNALALLAPLAWLGWLVLPLAWRRERREEFLSIAAVALPMSLLLLFVHPQQGMFRDLDVLAPGAVALSFVAAWAIGRTIESDRSHRGLAVAVTATCLACTIGWLGVTHDTNRGEAWVRGFTAPDAGRSPIEAALTWDYLGFAAVQETKWQQAADAWRETNKVVATARTLSQLAMAETMLGHLEEGRDGFRRALAIDPSQTLCWRGVASTSFRLGDYAEARRAVRELQRRGASPPELPDLLRQLEAIEARNAAPARPAGSVGTTRRL